MSDPAVEAAQRAYAVNCADATVYDEAVTAAREMAKPIRTLHAPEYDEDLESNQCYECSDDWPCDTAKLVYTTEELER